MILRPPLKFVLVLSSVLLSGCLKTRNEVKDGQQRQVIQQQVVTLQKSNADVGGRFSELEEELRNLNGRVDIVENKVGSGSANLESVLKSSQQQNSELNQKVGLLQEALTKMEKDLLVLNADVQALKAERLATQTSKSVQQGRKEAQGSYEEGQDFFAKKDWKQAILNFQKYRDENPKGAKLADATYKIGVSFQELGMKEEAKTFYDEVISKYAKTDEARRARLRLKGLKK